MPRIQAGERQENIALPTELVERIETYRFERKLRSKKDAYKELLENGLKVADEEKTPRG